MTNPMPDWLGELTAPLPEDSADLRCALETFWAMWQRGDRTKTMLWLRQAIETARGDGQDNRANALARGQFELERALGGVQPSAPPASLAPASPQAASAHFSPASRSPEEAGPPTIRRELFGQTHRHTPDPKLLAALRTTDAPVVPPSSGVSARSSKSLGSTFVMQPDGSARQRDTHEEPTVETSLAMFEPYRARRVAVHDGAGRQLVVTVLEDDEPAPPGALEALLLALPRSR